MTAGIVSAKNRGVGITARESFIQTDAAINPGNSGGPLVNLRGEVIGINTAISSRSGGNNGVGFAVPSNLAHWVGDQLLASGHVSRSYLGVSIQPVSYELSSQLGVAPKSGVAVTDVFPKTPAAKSGLKAGDVIAKFDGKPVTTPQQLQLAVEQSPMGKPLTMDVIRNGKSIELTYEPESAPGGFGADSGSTPRSQSVNRNALGLEIEELSKEIAKQLGMADAQGVLVAGVQSGSAADSAGLEPGMVIVQVNRVDVSTLKEFEAVVNDDTDGSILLLVRTEQGSRFVAVNCAALSESLLESELFGHVKGAFTDARGERRGLFLEADGGVLLLDEMGEMPMAMQVKLLRALEERKVRPVGSDKETAFDVRVLTATNRDLEAAVAEGRFREDLYYRINVIGIELPPLRSRGNDILRLAEHFTTRFSESENKPVSGLADGVAEKLLGYSWPGNVRELRNVIERAVALTRYDKITVEDLPDKVRNFTGGTVFIGGLDPAELVSMEEIERRYINHVLEACGGNQTQAAHILGLDRKTIYRKTR